MTAFTLDGSLPPGSNDSSFSAPQYPDELHTQTPRLRLPEHDGDGLGLASPLLGLPRLPPARPATQLDQTLSAEHFFRRYEPHHSATPTPTYDRLLAFGRFRARTQPQGLNSTPFHPQQNALEFQHTPSHELFNPSSTQQVPHAFSDHVSGQFQQRHHVEGISAQIPYPRGTQISGLLLNQTGGFVPGFAREATTPASPVGEEDRQVFGAQSGDAASPSDFADDGNLRPPGVRARGRPKNPETQPKKRRKKGTGQAGGWSKGMKIGPRQAIDPGPEFNALYLQATEAYIDEGDTDRGYELVTEAIRINPEIYAAHVLLAEIYESRGEDEKFLATLFAGAHTMPTDPDVWFQTAHLHLERHTGMREHALQQASYCLSRILHVNSARDRHVEARFQRAAVNRELTNFNKAMKDLEIILETMPRNSSVLRQIAEICLDIKDVTKAKELYENTLAYYRENGFENEESFTWADILVYAQILANEEPPDVATANALKVLKQLSRWLQGREEQAYWDEITDDDREFDLEDERRVFVPEFIPDSHAIEAYGPGIPLEIRVRLGMLRLRQGEEAVDEAMAHFDWLDADDREEGANIYQYPDLFLEVAQGLHEMKEFDQALRYFHALKETNAYAHTDFWLAMGASSYMCGDRLSAVECYEEAKMGDAKSVEARTQLSKLYADFGDKEMAMENAREAIRLAETLLPNHGKRKYEPKELRLSREHAELALKEAFQLSGDYAGGIPIERIESKLDMVGRGKHRKRVPQKVPAYVDEESQLGDEGEHDGEITPETEREMARRIAKDVERLRDDRLPARFEAHPPKYEYRVKRLTVKEREARRTDTINGLYQSLLDNTEAMRNSDKLARHTWMDCADTLLKDFRSNRAVYSDDRIQAVSSNAREALLSSRKKWQENQQGTQDEEQEDDPDIPLPSVESNLPTEYREIPFSDWLDIFLEYALLLSLGPDTDSRHRCYTIIDAALSCILWKRDAQPLLQIYVTYLACALALKDADTLYNVVLRWFMKTYEFNNDAYRLVAAINLVYPHAHDQKGKEGQMSNAMFRGRAMHQFVLKQLFQADSSLPMDYNPKEYGPVPSFMRKNGGGDDAQSTRSKDDFPATPAVEDTPDTHGTEQTPAPTERTPDPTNQTSAPPTQRSTSLEQGFHDIPFPRASSQHRDFRSSTDITELNPLLLLLYGQMLTAAGTHTGAISCLLRAQSLDPRNPVILLSIALSYMHHVLMKRCANRHMMLMQGWAFFEEYAECRKEWAREKMEKWIAGESGQNGDEQLDLDLDLNGLEAVVEREIEFNRAKCWHLLGMADLAVKGYEKVLSLPLPLSRASTPASAADGPSETSGVKHSDFAMDAAYAISTIYALSGNTEMAREVTEKYLVV